MADLDRIIDDLDNRVKSLETNIKDLRSKFEAAPVANGNNGGLLDIELRWFRAVFTRWFTDEKPAPVPDSTDEKIYFDDPATPIQTGPQGGYYVMDNGAMVNVYRLPNGSYSTKRPLTV